MKNITFWERTCPGKPSKRDLRRKKSKVEAWGNVKEKRRRKPESEIGEKPSGHGAVGKNSSKNQKRKQKKRSKIVKNTHTKKNKDQASNWSSAGTAFSSKKTLVEQEHVPLTDCECK